MKMCKKVFPLLCAAMMASVPIGFCFAEAASPQTMTVQVQSVDSGTVTAIMGTLTQSSSGMPSALPSDGGQGQPPELPQGSSPGDMGGTPPDAGSVSGGNPPGDMMGFEAGSETVTFDITASTTITVEFLQGSQQGTAESIVVGAVLEVTMDADNHATSIVVKNMSAGGGFGSSSTVTNGTSANAITEDGTYTGGFYTSSGDDENALRIDGATVTLAGATVEKSTGASSNTEDGDFYGQNAAILVLNGATANIQNVTVSSSVTNGNGVFSYGTGTVVNISDSTIRTTENNSGGIHTTGGGTTNASNLDVETQGNSAAAIRSDRGGGTVTVTGGTYTSHGSGSPAVYCTADITVSDATLISTSSEAVVVEGKNSVALNNCTLTGNMKGISIEETGEHIHNIMIYQSMSGDADVGLAKFSASGGSITAQAGDMFYVTNTSCEISIADVQLTLANDILLSVEGNNSSRGWGTVGANGGKVTFAANNQAMEGDIHVDTISSLSLTMENGTSFTGSINSDGQEGEVSVTLENSTWTLTADSYITAFDGDADNIVSNGYTLYISSEAIS